MKKLAIVLLISLLFQSCFSYTRAIDFNAGAVVEKQKVKIYKNNGTELKGKVLSANKDEIAIIYSKTKQVLKIPVKDISGVQGSELSVGKSVAIPLGIITGLILLLLVALAGSGISG